MAAVSATWSSGKSRKTRRSLPVSISSLLILGKVSRAKSAQCEQVSEKNSIAVTGASGLPMARSEVSARSSSAARASRGVARVGTSG